MLKDTRFLFHEPKLTVERLYTNPETKKKIESKFAGTKAHRRATVYKPKGKRVKLKASLLKSTRSCLNKKNHRRATKNNN